MSGVGRRCWLQNLASAFVAGRFSPIRRSPSSPEPESAGKSLQLKDFEPRSMLHVPENKVPRSRYPLIDVHTHLSHKAKEIKGVGIGETMRHSATADAVLPLMDRKNIRMMVNLTGAVGKGLEGGRLEISEGLPRSLCDLY